MRRKVVITGIGAVTPLGNTFHESWQALIKGVSGIAPLDAGISGTWQSAGMLKGFDGGAYLSRKEMMRLDPFVHYGAASAMMALEDAGLKSGLSEEKAGVIIGSSRGGILSMEKALKTGTVSAYLMPATTIGMAASFTAQKAGIKGGTLGISNSCSSGANAIGEAYRLIRHGMLDIALAGGSEAPLCRISFEGYGVMGALSEKGVMMPFDRKRDGFVISEGAAVLVLEEHESALKRGARVYAEVAGYANTADAFHQTMPDKAGQAGAMKAALMDAGIGGEEVDFINAHATATQLGDRAEAEAIGMVFGREMSPQIPITANKSMTGHMLGASASFEAAATAMSIYTGIIPAVINLKEPEFDLNYVTAARKTEIKTALTNSFGFGGVNAVLILRGHTSPS